MNKLFQQLNPISQRLPSNIQQMIQAFKAIKNPQAYVEQELQKNPQLKSMIEAAGGNPEKAFRDMAKEMNIDADEIIKFLSLPMQK